jgi:hypothetical protein
MSDHVDGADAAGWQLESGEKHQELEGEGIPAAQGECTA